LSDAVYSSEVKGQYKYICREKDLSLQNQVEILIFPKNKDAISSPKTFYDLLPRKPKGLLQKKKLYGF
jgi:hypothetical protein